MMSTRSKTQIHGEGQRDSPHLYSLHSHTMKILGYILLSFPFVAVIGLHIKSIGVLGTLIILSAIASTIVCISLGLYLIG